MSMFICIACDQYADSDDGCVEAPANYANKQHAGLICETCIGNGVLEDDDEPINSNVDDPGDRKGAFRND